MRKRLAIVAVTCAGMLAAVLPQWGQTAGNLPTLPLPQKSTVTDDQVVAALRRGVDYLLAHKMIPAAGAAHWESGHWQSGAESALVLYALLHTGASLRDDPVYGTKLLYRSDDLGPAVAWLANADPDEANAGRGQATYMASLQACALALVPHNPADAKKGTPEFALERAQKYLIAAMGLQGGYTYNIPTSRPNKGPGDGVTLGDLSNAQYAALGMWALEEAGLKAPPGYWQTTDRFWRILQRPSGSWPYFATTGNNLADRDTMGIAGIATLFIAQEFVDRTLHTLPLDDPNIDTGLSWLNANFKSDTGDLYYMYGVERVGLASGRRFFGTTDWYRQCAADILAHQNPDGSWDARSWGTRGFLGQSDTTATSYALLFLARGRNPVLFNKLQYDGSWNARPMDAAFVSRSISRKIERPLNWQVVNLQVSGTDWLDAPILLITGSKEPAFSEDDLAKLRAFIEGGGMIFSTADDGNVQFTNAIKRIAALVGSNKYEMRQLPRTSPFFSNDLNPALQSPPTLWAMSNGIREVWIHSPVDMGASWQLQRTAATTHFEVPAALYFYATGKSGLPAKLKSLDIPPPSAIPSQSLTMARVMYTGAPPAALANWDPEPGAWPRLAAALRSPGVSGIDLKILPLAPRDLDAKKQPLAHLIAPAKFSATGADCVALRKYLDDGGLLILEAGGGNPAALASLTEMAEGIYPTRQAAPLPPDNPLITGAFVHAHGPDVTHIDFRKYGTITFKQKIEDPALDAIIIDGRVKILISRYDVTSGLLGTNTWGILGYTPDSARKIAENWIHLALENH